MKKVCLNCKEPLEGRIDKVFCNAYCKSNYHYQQKKEEITPFKQIDKQLKLNRRLLAHYNQAGKSTIRKEKLLSDGFNPNFYTHTWHNSKGQTYYFCYDYGFLPLDEKGTPKFILVTYQEQYMGTLPDL